jgi:hypothetical protein
MANSDPTSADAPAPVRPITGVFSRLGSWLWRGEEMRAVEARLAASDPALTHGLQQAASLLLNARILADLKESAAELACSKEAVHVLARAHFREPLEIVAVRHRGQLEQLCGDPELVERALRVLIDLDSSTVASPVASEALDTVSAVMRRFATALYQGLSKDRLEKGRILAGRIGRLGALSVSLVVLAGGTSYGLSRMLAPPDLTPGASWRASSVYAGCDLKAHTCDGNATDVFFHTQQEQNPFIEYDLGSQKQVRRVDVTNRSDCCQERAIPLLVELSDDRKQWREVARRAETFRSIKLSFAPTEARYVRLRAADDTWLHLEKVAIRGQ